MSLEKWVEDGWLRREATSPGEIKDLLGIVERGLADFKVEAISTDLRFIAAFSAALTVATTALRASVVVGRLIHRPQGLVRRQTMPALIRPSRVVVLDRRFLSSGPGRLQVGPSLGANAIVPIGEDLLELL